MHITNHWFKGHLRDVPRDECLELLDSRQVGRVGFIDRDGLVVLPVNYSMHDGAVYIATSPATRLSAHATEGPVAFEIDDIDEFNETGWSVVVRGRAAMVPFAELPAVKDMPYPWPEGPRLLVLRIVPTKITGRRLFPV